MRVADFESDVLTQPFSQAGYYETPAIVRHG